MDVPSAKRTSHGAAAAASRPGRHTGLGAGAAACLGSGPVHRSNAWIGSPDPPSANACARRPRKAAAWTVSRCTTTTGSRDRRSIWPDVRPDDHVEHPGDRPRPGAPGEDRRQRKPWAAPAPGSFMPGPARPVESCWDDPSGAMVPQPVTGCRRAETGEFGKLRRSGVLPGCRSAARRVPEACPGDHRASRRPEELGLSGHKVIRARGTDEGGHGRGPYRSEEGGSDGSQPGSVAV